MLVTPAEAAEQCPGYAPGHPAFAGAIQVAGELIASYLGYPSVGAAVPTAESTTYVLYLDGVRGADVPFPGSASGRYLVSEVLPLVSISSIYDDPDRDYDADSLVSSSDYSIEDAAAGIVKLSSTAAHGAWQTGKRNIKLTCVAGYATPPAWLKRACVLTVRALVDSTATQGKSTLTKGGEVVTMRGPDLIPLEAQRILDPHVLPRMYRC